MGTGLRAVRSGTQRRPEIRHQICRFRLEQSVTHHGTRGPRVHFCRTSKRVYHSHASRTEFRHCEIPGIFSIQKVSFILLLHDICVFMFSDRKSVELPVRLN